MSDTNDFGGPVSKALEADLRAWVRKHGIAPWLDADGHYRKFVERLIVSNAERELPYEVRAFRGSYLDLMMELEGVANGTEKTPLVVHLPGLNQESVRETPLLELYAAGTRYRKGLATLVSEAAGGRVSPEQISEFQSTAELSLEAADVWLSAALASGESGFGAQLRLMTPSAILDDLLAGGSIAAEMARAGGLESLWQHLDAVTGLPGTWRDRTLPARRSTSSAKSPPSVKDVAFTAASWCLAVEYVDDLRRSPIAVAEVLSGAVGLPKAVVSTCRAVAVHLRARENPAFYEQTADATEAMLFEEVDKAKAEDLGSVDTFRFEDDTVLNAALAALGADSWDTAADWASSRIGSEAASATHWLRKDPMRQSTWQLISDAAALGSQKYWGKCCSIGAHA